MTIAPAPLSLHCRCGGAAEVQGCPEIDLDDPVPVLVGHVFERLFRLACHATGVADEDDRWRARSFLDGRYPPGGCARSRRSTLDRVMLSCIPSSASRMSQPKTVAPAVAKRLGDGAAEADRRAADRHCLASEIQHVGGLPFILSAKRAAAQLGQVAVFTAVNAALRARSPSASQ